jgi:hypothetical protein
LALAWNFLQFLDFFDWPTIETNGKRKNSALNMFLVMNEPEKQEFSLKKPNFSRFSDLVCGLGLCHLKG